MGKSSADFGASDCRERHSVSVRTGVLRGISHVIPAQKTLQQFIVIRVSADPIPDKSVRFEPSKRPVMNADADGPFAATDLLEMKRRMQGVSQPKAICLSC